MTFAEKLMDYRQQTGHSLPTLAGWMGLSLPTYRRTESGQRSPRAGEIDRLATRSGISSDQWQNPAQPLPALLPAAPEPVCQTGRPVKVTTPARVSLSAARANRIQKLIRDKYEDNARQFAQAIAMHETLLSGYLNGKREITDRLLLRIVRMIPGVSIDYLRAGVGPVEPVAADQPGEGTLAHDGRKLNEYLLKTGLNYVDLAELTGKSYSTARTYQFRQTLRHDTRHAIATALKISPQTIWGC